MSKHDITAAELLENLNTAILVFDKNQRLLSINAAGENLLSTSYRKIAGLNAGEILPASSWFTRMLRRALANRRIYTEWGLELPVPDAEPLIVGCVMTPFMRGEQCREVIVELIDSQAMTRAMREESLQAVHEAASKSLGGMAHEIKNPLGGLRGAAQLLERELIDEELKEYTRIIISEADRLRNLVDRMLAPSGEPNMVLLNIHEVLEYVHDLVQAEANEQLAIERDYDPSLPDLRGDREQLIQALLNVCRNAVQAIRGVPDGRIWLKTRVKRKCTLRQRQHKLVAQIDIIDNGAGIPADIEAEVFYPLVTGRPEGTGLGLSVTQALLQKHGGTIDYSRVKDKTIFRILLPIGQADE